MSPLCVPPLPMLQACLTPGTTCTASSSTACATACTCEKRRGAACWLHGPPRTVRGSVNDAAPPLLMLLSALPCRPSIPLQGTVLLPCGQEVCTLGAAGERLCQPWLKLPSGWRCCCCPHTCLACAPPQQPAHPAPLVLPQFPGLINGCTIDWYLPWPEEALTAVSSKFLDSFAIECAPEVQGALKQMMASVHMQVTEACQVCVGWGWVRGWGMGGCVWAAGLQDPEQQVAGTPAASCGHALLKSTPNAASHMPGTPQPLPPVLPLLRSTLRSTAARPTSPPSPTSPSSPATSSCTPSEQPAAVACPPGGAAICLPLLRRLCMHT